MTQEGRIQLYQLALLKLAQHANVAHLIKEDTPIATITEWIIESRDSDRTAELRKNEELEERFQQPIPMLLACPSCGERHIDKGEFATKSHHTHSCQHCGHTWRPALVPTVGVQFLPGFKNSTSTETWSEAIRRGAPGAAWIEYAKNRLQIIHAYSQHDGWGLCNREGPTTNELAKINCPECRYIAEQRIASGMDKVTTPDTPAFKHVPFERVAAQSDAADVLQHAIQYAKMRGTFAKCNVEKKEEELVAAVERMLENREKVATTRITDSDEVFQLPRLIHRWVGRDQDETMCGLITAETVTRNKDLVTCKKCRELTPEKLR